jgi:hypothetical protein
VAFDAGVYRRGSRLSTVGVTMSSEDGPLLRMLGSFHNGHSEDDSGSGGAVERDEADPPDMPGPDECIRVEPAQPFPPPIMGKVDLRLHPQDATLSSGRPLSGVGFACGTVNRSMPSARCWPSTSSRPRRSTTDCR